MFEAKQEQGGAEAEASVGAQLQALRQARSLSLGALARLSGISGAALSRWENEKRLPLIPELEAVLNALEVSEATRRDILRRINAPRALVHLRKLDAAASSGGDLLQALRLRKGWTQAQTARAVGVNQSQIARWEQGDAWPSAEKIHALCWYLGASAEEMAELSATGAGGQFSGSSTPATGEPALPPEGKELSPEAAMPWTQYVKQHLFSPSFFVLRLFQLEHRLSVLAARHPIAEQLLPNAYAIQARSHLQWREPRQAEVAAQRGLALARRRHLPAGENAGVSLWFGNAIVLASVAAEGNSPAGLRRAVHVLTHWLPAVENCPAHHSWGCADLASYLARLGRADEAVTLSERACRRVMRTAPAEYAYRLHDHAKVLAQVGRTREALRALRISRTIDERPESADAFFSLRQAFLEAECLLSLEDRGGADERLRVAEQIAQRNRLDPVLSGYVRATTQMQKTKN